MTTQDESSMTPVSQTSVHVAHIVGGQTLIGQLVKDSQGHIHMRFPYEVMAIPSESNQGSTVSVFKFGTMVGLVPELGLDSLPLGYGRIMGNTISPSVKLLEIYQKALLHEASRRTAKGE